MRRLLVALGALAMAFATALPVHAETRAGGWATTELDPLPDKLVANKAYTIGYWVLQHGTHPFDIAGEDLGSTGLRLTSTSGGTTLNFTGTPLPEPAHYAVTIKIPDGQWRLQGIQGMFLPYEIGTLDVPGGLTPAPPKAPMSLGIGIVDYWGTIKPPGFPWDGEVTSSQPPAPPATAAPAAVAQPEPAAAPAAPASPKATVATDGDDTPPYLPVAVTAVLAIGATLLAQRLVRARVRPGHPADSGPQDGAASDDDDFSDGARMPDREDEPGSPSRAEDVITIGRE
ncbi:hypothetical protein GCM10023194_10450 [Planotetraspora phitsanulokensis]|uniref:Uncharacterized protein n=1 Tax=Planotetraspora phitsanulokensis TaxID=575192 RepID=A0A8J3U993_9ACTN|nr:hypothetical protein [Planotetraspora phitsanulokensis]GII40630.1 hypothetical protein Pph01_56330 [Planotetraspora phitsanulokensis]